MSHTDKNFNGSIRKIFIETIENLEPIDVRIFDDINRFCLAQPNKYEAMASLTYTNYLQKESLNVLLSCGLLTYGVSVTNSIKIGSHAPTTFHGLDRFRVKEMGQSFYKSVNR